MVGGRDREPSFRIRRDSKLRGCLLWCMRLRPSHKSLASHTSQPHHCAKWVRPCSVPMYGISMHEYEMSPTNLSRGKPAPEANKKYGGISVAQKIAWKNFVFQNFRSCSYFFKDCYKYFHCLRYLQGIYGNSDQVIFLNEGFSQNFTHKITERTLVMRPPPVTISLSTLKFLCNS